ncbi:MAG: hypothetical protein EKK62_16845 [Acidimicrobiia bacterium]|nr:MAG: hypothetical protein EKK62_16845 [Acidimicrobiia bacterium]
MPSLFPTRAFRRTRERSSGLLFALGVDDLSSTLTTGQTLTLARSSGRTTFDSVGRVVTLAHSQMPWSTAYNATSSSYEPILSSDRIATNLCLQSENFGTTWTAIGTPTRTATAAYCGDLALDLIGDDAAGTLEGYSQVITFTASAVKAVSLFIKQGTSTSSVIRLRDTTASANRLLATVTWSGGVPSVAMTTGTSLGQVACYNGVYRLLFLSSSVTAANTNQLEIYPATTSALAVANTGTLYAGGVMAQNAAWPQAYIKTTTGTVTTGADLLTSTFAATPQDFTVYVRFPAPPFLAGLSGIGGAVFGLGNSASGANFYAVITSSGIGANITDGSTSVGATTALTAATWYDVAIQYNNVTSAARVRIDTGSGFGSYSSASGGITAWNSSTLRIAHLEDGGGAGYQLDGGIRKLVIAPGARTLAEMQGLNV